MISFNDALDKLNHSPVFSLDFKSSTGCSESIRRMKELTKLRMTKPGRKRFDSEDFILVPGTGQQNPVDTKKDFFLLEEEEDKGCESFEEVEDEENDFCFDFDSLSSTEHSEEHNSVLMGGLSNIDVIENEPISLKESTLNLPVTGRERSKSNVYDSCPSKLAAKAQRVDSYWKRRSLLIPNVFKQLKNEEDCTIELQDMSRKELLVQLNGAKNLPKKKIRKRGLKLKLKNSSRRVSLVGSLN